MCTERRAALTLVILGLCLPIFCLLFISGYDPDASLVWNLHHMEVILREQRWVHPSGLDETLEHIRLAVTGEKPYPRFGGMMLKPGISIHYKYILLFGVFCIIIGTGIIPLSHSAAEHSRHASHHRKTTK